MADNNTKIQNEGGTKGLLNAKANVVTPSYNRVVALSSKLQELTDKLLDTKAAMMRKLEEQRAEEEKRAVIASQKEAEKAAAEQAVVKDEKIEEVKENFQIEEKRDIPAENATSASVSENAPAEKEDMPVIEKENIPVMEKEKAVSAASEPEKPAVQHKSAENNTKIKTKVFDNNGSKQGNYGAQRPPRTDRPQNNNRDGHPRPQNQDKTQRPYDKNNQQHFQSKKPNTYAAKPAPMPPVANTKGSRSLPANKKNVKKADEKKGKNVKTLINQGYIQKDNYSIYNTDDSDARYNKKRKKQNGNGFNLTEKVVIENAVMTSTLITVKQLAEKIGKTGSEIIKILFKIGIMKTINDAIDFDTADLVASELGINLTYEPEKTAEDKLQDIQDEADTDIDANSVTRPPIITIMGHVDHGKTSLLDYIRKTNVATGEAGGITQHIGAYTVNLNGKKITFLDTPGHEAFTSMRMRGAQVTDIAIIVVAADDGIMPQTVEAINHAKLANVTIIVAVNKIDKPGANPERVLKQLTEYELVPEEWGGTTPVVKVSAKTGFGINDLLETILVTSELLELKANPDRKARGSIIEAKLDKGKGPLATVLVQNGTLRVGDYVVAGTTTGKIRGMIDDKGKNVKAAGPSTPVSVLGFSEVPNAGDQISVVDDEKLAKQVATERSNKIKDEMNAVKVSTSLDDFFAQMKKGEMKTLNIIIKADVQGSVEAVKQSLVKLSNDEVHIAVIHGAVGAINESDVMLASTSGAIIIGFNVRPDQKAKANADRDNIDIRLYRIIYDAIDDVNKAIKGMLAPKFKETVLGNAEVRQVYKITGVGAVAGCYVTDGKVARNGKVRLYRDNTLVYDGELASLKRFKDDAKEVAKGYECGMSIVNFNDIKEGDVMEVYIMEQINE